MFAYKGFDQNFCCRGIQYEIGKLAVYDGELKPGFSGLHFCINPIHVFQYYSPVNSRYALVDVLGDIESNQFLKCTNKLVVVKELSIQEFINCTQAYFDTIGSNKVLARNKNYSILKTKGYCSVSATGHNCTVTVTDNDLSVAANTGDSSVSISNDSHSIAAVTGYKSLSKATKESSVSVSTGDGAKSVTYGNSSIAVGTGFYNRVRTFGKQSIAVSNDRVSAISVEGEESLGVAFGGGPAKGSLGSWLVLSEHDHYTGKVIDVKCFKVDGNTIKPNTFYVLKRGLLVEVLDVITPLEYLPLEEPRKL